LLVLALVLSFWYLRVVRRSNRYAVVTGKGYRPKLYHLRPKGIALGWGFVGMNLAFAMVLPFLVLVWASITPYFQPPSAQAFSTVTLDAYRFLSWSVVGGAVKNTLIIMIAVPTLTALFALAISWVVTRSKTKGISPTFEVLAFVPHAVPNIIFAVGALIIGLRFLPEFIPFYGTIYIMIVVFMITRLSFATRVYNSSFIQIHHELDEAGYVFGLGRVKVLWWILRPLLTPALLYTWVWMALLAYRELTLAAILSSRENTVLALKAWQLWESDLARGAALTVVMTLGIMPLVAVYFYIARRIGRVSA
jgi:iron(III) transport system permease protein